MSSTAIRVRHLGKQYQLGIETRGYATLREALISAVKSPWRRLRHLAGVDESTTRFWAVDDVSFDVAQGDVVGIIGHNGAGKSTLLKILSQITEPTTGEVQIWGRVASLLEVGTGFHPELSGRENIFLNGAILGMATSEIKRKFDEIVAFAGVESFLDTPVKRYSSGMSVRLAFAVAAHLEPEILVVDEVLAVGDAEFQRKCLGKMGEVAKGGRTVLFVSHNMAAVEALCPYSILLSRGKLVEYGATPEIISRYFHSASTNQGEVDLLEHPGRPPRCSPMLRRLRISNDATGANPFVPVGGDLHLQIELSAQEPVHDAIILFRVSTPRGLKLFTCSTQNDIIDRVDLSGMASVSCTIRNLRLLPGSYDFTLAVKNARGDVVDEITSGLGFEVVASNVSGSGRLPPPQSGILVAEADWRIR